MAGMEIFLIIIGVTAIIGSFVFEKTLEKNENTNENKTDIFTSVEGYMEP